MLPKCSYETIPQIDAEKQVELFSSFAFAAKNVFLTLHAASDRSDFQLVLSANNWLLLQTGATEELDFDSQEDSPACPLASF